MRACLKKQKRKSVVVCGKEVRGAGIKKWLPPSMVAYTYNPSNETVANVSKVQAWATQRFLSQKITEEPLPSGMGFLLEVMKTPIMVAQL